MEHAALHTPLTGLAGHLVNRGLLEPDFAHSAIQQANQQNLSLLRYLIKNNILTSTAIAQSFGLPIVDLSDFSATESLIRRELIHRYRIIPLRKQASTLQIGMADPTDQASIDAIMFHTGLRIQLCVVKEDQLQHFIDTHYPLTTNKNLTLSLLNEIDVEEETRSVQENAVTYDEPLIRFVDHLIQHALQQAASDIHIEPYENTCRIRYRQDGILYEVAKIPIHLASRLVTRLKVMAKLDISERRLPHDGRLQLNQTNNTAIDIRVNTCPTLFGEKMVLRILNVNKISIKIDDLGFTHTQKNLFLKKISQPQGMILVTGPTGSGKTVTLYSALNYLNTPEKNISTIEDPVEIQLAGINQVNVNPKIGLNFAVALRTFLRQDPDIIMVGEIRDTETAEIATQAAQTGHLVLSTVHTNSAIETLARLQSMGVAAHHLGNAVSLIVAQRLLRKLCAACKQPEAESTFHRAVGCQHCYQGYRGRIGIYELLPITDNISNLMLSTANTLAIAEQAQHEGFSSLRSIAIEKASQGITTLSEINRVIQQ